MTTTATQETKVAPAGAFSFEASTCQFAEPQARDKSGLRRAKIDVLARTGNPVNHWWWGRVVHDFAGMKSKDRVAFDSNHDYQRPVGYADKIMADKELRLSGELISRKDDDSAAEIMDLGPAGVPYQASIQFNPDTCLCEFVPEGFMSEVNGQTVDGPITIIREWELLRCAICLTGVDTGSQANFSSDPTVAQFSLRWKDSSAMSSTKKPGDGATNTADGKPVDGGQLSQANNVVSGEMKIDESSIRAQFQAELKKYNERFGVDGAAYFAEGLNFTAALERHVGKLETDLKAALTAKEAAEAKLAQLNIGEVEGVDTGTLSNKGKTGEDPQQKGFQGLFRSRDAAPSNS